MTLVTTRTHTYVVLDVSEPAFNEISEKLVAAGYIRPGTATIDMHGIAIEAIAAPVHTAVAMERPTLTVNGFEVAEGYTLVKAKPPVCFGDGSKFCCARNGCHAVCNCTVKP